MEQDGSEAVRICEDRPNLFSLVLLDMTMPGMDGEETFRRINAIRDDVPVILCSGFSEQQVTDRFVGRSIAGFLKKPYRLQELRDCVKAAL